jgi:hypothetical protein
MQKAPLSLPSLEASKECLAYSFLFFSDFSHMGLMECLLGQQQFSLPT